MPRLIPLTILVTLALGCTPETDSPPDPEDGLHGRIQVVDGRDVMQLWGTREEMGYAEGALYCEKMAVLFKSYVLEYLVADYGVGYELIQMLVDNAVDIEPGDLAEMEGIWNGALDHCDPELLIVESEYLEPDADGARELEFEDLVAANILGDFGCSSFTVWGEASATGDTIHARNFDWAIDPGGVFLDQHVIKVYSSAEEGGARFASLMVPGMIGCVSCVTEDGASLTMHNVGGLDATQSTGIKPRMLANREALTATFGAGEPVAAAEAIFEARPQRVGNNLHLAYSSMAAGPGAVVFEYDGASDHADGQATVRFPGDDPGLTTADAITCTNHYINRSTPPTSGNSYDRLATLQAGIDAAVASGGLDAEGARALINEVANHTTAHSVVIDGAAREFRVYIADVTGTPAPTVAPVVLDLDELWADMP